MRKNQQQRVPKRMTNLVKRMMSKNHWINSSKTNRKKMPKRRKKGVVKKSYGRSDGGSRKSGKKNRNNEISRKVERGNGIGRENDSSENVKLVRKWNEGTEKFNGCARKQKSSRKN